MCVILSRDFKPTSTRLVTYRARKDLLHPLKSYVTVYQNRAMSAGTGEKQLMIVPFPQSRPDAKAAEFPLGAPQTEKAEKELWQALERTYPNINATSAHERSALGMSDDAPEVQQVGGYKMTVALDYAHLMKTPWHEFSMHSQFEQLLDDVRNRFGRNYGFILAMPAPHPETAQLGGTFAWMWHGDHPYLPTAHELQADRLDSPATTDTKYNMTGWVLEPHVPQEGYLTFMQHPDYWVESKYLSVHVPNPASEDRRIATTTIIDRVLGEALAPASFTGLGLRVDISNEILGVNDNMVWMAQGAMPVHDNVDASSSTTASTSKTLPPPTAPPTAPPGILKKSTSAQPSVNGAKKRPMWQWLVMAGLIVVAILLVVWLVRRFRKKSSAEADGNLLPPPQPAQPPSNVVLDGIKAPAAPAVAAAPAAVGPAPAPFPNASARMAPPSAIPATVYEPEIMRAMNFD